MEYPPPGDISDLLINFYFRIAPGIAEAIRTETNLIRRCLIGRIVLKQAHARTCGDVGLYF